MSQAPLTPGTMMKSDSGQTYKVEEVLVDRRQPLLCVYRARFVYSLGFHNILANRTRDSGVGRNYIVKNMIQGEFDYQLELQRSLSACSNVRSVIDTIKELEIFIYPFLSGELLRLSQKDLSKETRKHILRSALQGLADMHNRNILHNGKL
jgi:hypothetical protein